MTVESKPTKHVAPKVAMTIAKKIAQRKGFVVPQVFGFVSKWAFGGKFGSSSKRFATMKSIKVDFAAKMVPEPVPPTIATYSFNEMGKFACMGSCEKSIDFVSGEFLKICALLKADLFEDVDACTKFFYSV